MPDADDDRFMALALTLGRRGLGNTWPNPAVGAVVVKDGKIIGRGWTQPGGRPHAEALALKRAGKAAHGATLYVTLEPCSHQGKTPPCADAVLRAGIARVVSAMEDPNPEVAGQGHERLRGKNIRSRGRTGRGRGETRACRPPPPNARGPPAGTAQGRGVERRQGRRCRPPAGGHHGRRGAPAGVSACARRATRS